MVEGWLTNTATCLPVAAGTGPPRDLGIRSSTAIDWTASGQSLMQSRVLGARQGRRGLEGSSEDSKVGIWVLMLGTRGPL